MARKAGVFAISRNRFDAVIFDLDGVITRTAQIHAAAWKTTFDDFLKSDATRRHVAFVPFDVDSDYSRYVDGRPRYEGVASFLASRDIHLPHGNTHDAPGFETVCALGNLKNERFLQQVGENGVAVFRSSIDLIRQLRSADFKMAVVSSSRNTRAILEATNTTALFQAVVDGVEAARLHLQGKPAPDTFLEAAARLGVSPDRTVVVEDAVAGVRAGHDAPFGCVIGVDRAGQSAALKTAGADVVVHDLGEIALAA